MSKRYINVAYKDRDMAKRLGARWDPSVKRWYCPAGSALAQIYSWRKASPKAMMMPVPSRPRSVAANSNVKAPPNDRQLCLLG